jgi:hypothetical protein
MDMSDVLGWVVLIVLVFLAFRIGAFLMKVLLGLLAIALVVWLVGGLLQGADLAGAERFLSAFA